jgi:hypothetical protein
MTLRRSSALVLLAALLISTPAFAQSESDKATARALGQQGEAALESSNWKQAEDYFRRADSLFHAPTLTLGLARAQAHEGKFVEAWENYHRIIVDNLTTPPVFAKALEDARTELPSVEGQRARLTITVTGSDAPQVNVNDVPLKAAALGVARFVDPGHLVITVGGDGLKTETRALDLGPGKEDAVTIALTKAAPAVAATDVPVPAGSVATPTGPSGGGSILKPVGIGALGVGAAGLVLGAVTGGLALSKHGDLKTACPTGACDTAASQSTLSSYHTLGTLSTVGFVLGGVGLASGITLLVMAPKSDSRPASTASIRPYLGLGSLGATGTF